MFQCTSQAEGGWHSFVKQHISLEVKQFRGVQLNLGTLLCKYRYLCMRHNQGDSRGSIQTSTPHSNHQKCWEALVEALCGMTEVSCLKSVLPFLSWWFPKPPWSLFLWLAPSQFYVRVYLSRCSHKQHNDSDCAHCFVYFCTSLSEHWRVDKKVWLYRSQPISSATAWIWTKLLWHHCQRRWAWAYHLCLYWWLSWINPHLVSGQLLYSCPFSASVYHQLLMAEWPFLHIWHPTSILFAIFLLFTTAETPDFSPTMGSGRIKH